MVFKNSTYHLAKKIWARLPIPGTTRRVFESFFRYPHIAEAENKLPRYHSDSPIICGFLQSGLGIGEAARLEVTALRDAGIVPYLKDISMKFGMRNLEEDQFFDSEGEPPNGPLLLHVNAPQSGYVLKYLASTCAMRRPIIGIWAWELEQPPLGWHKAYKYFDELWLPSRHAAKAFKNDCPVPLKVVHHPLQALPTKNFSKRDFSIDPSACILLCMADGRSDLGRKNISGIISAFLEALARDEKCVLLVKLHHITEPELLKIYQQIRPAKNVRIIKEVFDLACTADLMRCCDIFISLHRAEGFGLALAEAMMLGKAVIATGYSGNMEFMNQDNSILVDYELIPVESSNNEYRMTPNALWAEPKLDMAASKIRCLAQDVSLRHEMGQKAKKSVLKTLDPTNFISAYQDTCGRLCEPLR